MLIASHSAVNDCGESVIYNVEELTTIANSQFGGSLNTIGVSLPSPIISPSFSSLSSSFSNLRRCVLWLLYHKSVC